MTRIESELHDLYEGLMRNDDMADRDTYHTIVGIANDIAEVEAENAKLREENAQLKDENEKLTTLVCHLMYVKPRDVTGIMYKGEVLHFDKLLEEVGLRWEDA